MSDEKFGELERDERIPETLVEIDEPREDEEAEPEEDDSWLYECSVTAD